MKEIVLQYEVKIESRLPNSYLKESKGVAPRNVYFQEEMGVLERVVIG
jgi:hypothetical protein